MRRLTVWAALVIGCLMAVLTATSTLAAPPLQESTLTPTATRVRIPGPTWTPTPTMLPLPANGGRVAVQAAAVRVEPFPNSVALGSLAYNSEVYPLGRSANGIWVAVNWQNTNVGWMLAEIVEWHPDLDVTALQVLIPPFDEAPFLVSRTPTEALPTDTPAPSQTSQPTSGETPTPELNATATLAQAPSATAAIAEVSDPATPEPTSLPTSAVTLPPIGPALPYIGMGIPVILLALYGWQFARGEREVRRYAKTFPLANCPVCQWGALSLDETIQRPLGIAHVTRTVRCNNCRSVLRQVDAGEWRYAIDPYINPQLAAEFDGKTFDDKHLREFAANAAAYPPAMSESDVPPPLTDEEILADLEARIPPPEEVIEEAAPETEDEVSDEIDSPPPDDQSEPPEDQAVE